MRLIEYGPGQLVTSLDADVVTMRQTLLREPRPGRRERNDEAATAFEAMKTQVPSDPLTAWGMGVLMCTQTWSQDLHGLILPQRAAIVVHGAMVGTACVGIYAYTGKAPYRQEAL